MSLTLTNTEVSNLEYLIERMWREAQHLDDHPGIIMPKRRYSDHPPEEREAIREELREIRDRYKVVPATHTNINLRRWANQLQGILDGTNRVS